MKNILTANLRNSEDKLDDLRKNGILPAVVYGSKVKNTLISISSIDFIKILKIAGETSTVLLEIKGNEALSEPVKKVDVLIHEIQYDPIKGTPVHVDFLAIDINRPVEVTVPLEYIGIAPAEKNGLGILVKVLYEIIVEALPKDLPQSIKVDLSTLENLDDQIHVENIIVANSIKILTDADEVVALISPMREEKIEETVVDLSSIEVEKKGKQEDDEVKE
jgi:large subunit ribosomal protein L25